MLLPCSVPLLTTPLCYLQPLSQSHPSGIHPHTQLQLPEGLSLAAASLLTQVRGLGGSTGLEAGRNPPWAAFPVFPFPLFSLQLLQHNPKRRLGAGGMAKLKSHSFFSSVPWNKLVG